MSRFRKILKKIVLLSDNQILQISILSILFLMLILIFIITQNDVLTLFDITVISTFLITFFAALSFNKLIDSIRVYVEDEIKVNYDFNKIKNLYPLDVKKGNFYKDENNNLWPIIILSDFSKNQLLKITDSKEIYILPPVISNHANQILNAHKASFIVNNKMIRLDEVKETEDSINIYTSRTTYLNTLITNRAIDYPITYAFTGRDIMEPGPYINPLENSTLSNHLGINIIMLDNEDNIILSERSQKVSVGKNKLGFGVSGALKSAYSLDDNYILTKDGLINGVIMEIKDELGICKNQLDFNFDNDLLCIYREIFEGGKPQFLLKCKVNLTQETIQSIFFNNEGVETSKKDSHSLKFIHKTDLQNAKYCSESIVLPSGETLNFTTANIPSLKLAMDLLTK